MPRRSGQAQPPFLLAANKKYMKLPLEWNVRGLARDEFLSKEKDGLAKLGYGQDYFEKIGVPGKKPFVSPIADTARVLHFNGRHKPWKRGRDREPDDPPTALCGQELVDCGQLWWQYLSPRAEEVLLDLERRLTSSSVYPS